MCKIFDTTNLETGFINCDLFVIEYVGFTDKLSYGFLWDAYTHVISCNGVYVSECFDGMGDEADRKEVNSE
jgi:hypothetical protein